MILNGFIYEDDKRLCFSLSDFVLNIFNDIPTDVTEFCKKHNTTQIMC
ncbi:MAG: hypothetical protein PHX09_04055 [Clostridia bacterium]|nr:hypothetical protein [Clostridia bacterium]MDD4686432.1 hypothetical protein [Clostridia bacterium]